MEYFRTTRLRFGLVLSLLLVASAGRETLAQRPNPLRAVPVQPASPTQREDSMVIAAQRLVPPESGPPIVEEDKPLKYKSEEWLAPGPAGRTPGERTLRAPGNGPPMEEEYIFEFEEPPGLFGGRLRHWLPVWGRPFSHGDPNDPDRYVGRGYPLVGTSWLNRPISVGFFAGGLFGDEPFDSRVNQGGGFLGGFRLGFDFDHYTGTELRVGISQLELFDNLDVPLNRTSNIGLFDLNLLYYPWGDSRIRPYFSFGLGIAAFDTFDNLGRNYNDAMLLMPFGVGLKYYGPWSVWRIDFMDNLAFGNAGIDTMHNLSLSLGWEFRFGVQPKLYFPVHPGVERW